MYEYILPLTVSLLLGMLLGLERSFAGKNAGMRTYGLVSLGSCLFVIISLYVAQNYAGVYSFDPLRLSAGVVSGIGFLGAGLMISQADRVRGLTTATGLWVSCGIGMAVGFEMYAVATFATALALITLSIFTSVESKLQTVYKKGRGVEEIER